MSAEAASGTRGVRSIPRSAGGAVIIWHCLSLAARLVWRRLPLLIGANLLWLLLSLLLVTWPAATAGLFSLMRRVVDEELDGAPHEARLADFWDGFRRDGMRGSLLTLLDLAALAIIVVALLFYGRGASEPLRWLVGPIALIGLAWLGAQLYLYPLLPRWPHQPPWQIAREALLIALAYPLITLPLLVISLVLAAASAVLAGPILLLYFSAMAMLQTVTLRYVLIAHAEQTEAAR